MTGSQSATRDPYLDNARSILIALVVVGHLLLTVGSPSAGIVATFIYSFHMPAFVFVTGFLSRRYTGTPQQATRLLVTVIVPYLIFQTIHATLDTLVMGRRFDVHVFQPAWTLWFLLGLVVWRLVTPLLRVLRYPVVFAVLISLLVPLSPGLDQTWSMARVLGFLPFYTLGLVIEPRVVDTLRSHRWRWAGLATLAIMLLLAWRLDPWMRVSDFYLSESYADRGHGPLLGVAVRAAVLGAGLIGTIAVLAVTSTRRRWTTRLGQHSLYVYLLHPLVLYPAQRLDVLKGFDSVADTIWLTAAGLALACVLASRPVVFVTRWLVQPPAASWFTRTPRVSA